jgi:DNA-directed RNA polymerase subunit RPC12/RpoP
MVGRKCFDMSKDRNLIEWIKDTHTNYLHVCGRCGATEPNNTKFKCSNCGRRVEQEERYCPSCGGKWDWIK